MPRPTVRITGLVRLADRVRIELGKGVTATRKSELRKLVDAAVNQVDQILRQRGAGTAQLASPSRRAHAFLAGIDWQTVSEASESTEAPAATGRLRWSGLGAFAERIAARLGAAQVDPAEMTEIGRAVDQMSRRIEQSIRRENLRPDQITPATREWRGWLAWMAESENLAAYAAAVGRARAALPTAHLVRFLPIRHIYKMRTRGGRVTLTLPTPMVRFDEAGFADLAELVSSRSPTAKRRVVERMRAEAYVDLMDELEALGGVVDATRGAFHDLAGAFDRVNAAYFGGGMPRPRLTWSRTFTRRKFGHYDHVRDWVMVSSTLDRPDVPQFVVDYLMFHELLHKKHGIRWVNGRGMAHTKAFYDEERQFPRYDEADGWLERLAKG